MSARPSRVIARLALLALLPATAHAVQFNVDTDSDLTDAVPGDGLCATSAGNCALRAAIQEANALAGVDRIELPPGVYRLTLTGADEEASATGDLDVSSELLIAASDPLTTAIESTGSDRVLDVQASGVLTVTGLTLRGGGSVSTGGGLRNAGVLLMQASIVEQNGGAERPVALGAGIGNLAVMTLTASVVRNNQASGVTAGGGGVHSLVTAVINGSRIHDNSVSGSTGSGGGLFAQGLLQLSTTSVDANSAANGGGIALSQAVGYLNASALLGNSATGTGVASGQGGGLRLNGGSATLVNVTVSGNGARRDGGGLQVAAGTLDLRNVTVTDNEADEDLNASGVGGGIATASAASSAARNSLLVGNRRGTSAADCAGPLASAGYLWLLTADGCTLQSAEGDVVGSDPQLQALADNGGLTLSHDLREGSPALDTANPNGCTGTSVPDQDGNTVDTPLVIDQRQQLRPLDGDHDQTARCDPGAIEFLSPQIFHDGFEGEETP